MSLYRGQYRRLFVVIFALVELLLFSGFAFGFNAFFPIYKKAGVFSHLCENATETSSFPECPEQESYYIYAFMVWLISPCFINLPLGIFIDKFGFRSAKFACAGFFLLSNILFALTSYDAPLLLFPAGMCAMASATILIIVNTQASRLYPLFTSILISLSTGCFDSSSIILTLMYWILKLNWTTSYLYIFIIYGLLGFSVILISTLFFFPASQGDIYKIIHQSTHDAEEELLEKNAKEQLDVSEKNETNTRLKEDSADIEVEVTPSANTAKFNDQVQLEKLFTSLPIILKSRFFLFTTIYFSVLFLRFNYFISALSHNLEKKFPGNYESYLEHFNYFLFCGCITSPIAGVLIDFLRARQKHTVNEGEMELQSWYWKYVQPLAGSTLIASVLALIVTILGFTSSTIAVYFSFFIFLLFRNFLFSSMYTCIVMGFPGKKFGILYGFINVIAGLFACLQYALLQASIHWGVDAVSGAILVLILFAFAQPLQIILGKHCPFGFTLC